MLIRQSFHTQGGSDIDRYMRTHPNSGACPVCAAIVQVDEECFSHLFSELDHVASSSEAVIDALGFCSRHGSLLAEQSDKAQGIARVFSRASQHLSEWLKNERIAEEKLQPMFLTAPKTCPACKFREHATATHLTKIAKLWTEPSVLDGKQNRAIVCLPHLRKLAITLEPSVIDRVLAIHFDEITFALRTLDEIGGLEQAATVGSDAGVTAAVESVAGTVAGLPKYELVSKGDEGSDLAAALQSNSMSTESLENPNICPVCLEVHRAVEKWINSLETAVEFGQDLWMVFPTCPEHVWTCLRRGSRRVALAATRQVADVMLRHLRRGAEALAPNSDASTEQQTAPSAPARKSARGIPRCQACERMNLAEDKATDQLLRLMQEQRFRHSLERGHGLCIKHFAYAYVFAPKNKIRSALLEIHTQKLESLRKDLDAALGSRSPDYFQIDSSGKNLSWKCAVYRFSGFI